MGGGKRSGRGNSGGGGQRGKQERQRRSDNYTNNKKRQSSGGYNPYSGSLEKQLSGLGLRRKFIEADGNCFFRALGDQLYGDACDHVKMRREVVEYMERQSDSFAPFVEDDESFVQYCARMRKDATWAGNMELQAASMLYQVNICVHQGGFPRWEICNFERRAGFVHLAYEGGEHYNSVRKASDHTCEAPRPFTVTDAGPPPGGWGSEEYSGENPPLGGEKEWSDAEQRVREEAACENHARVQQVLADMEGDVDAAIEAIKADPIKAEAPPPVKSGWAAMAAKPKPPVQTSTSAANAPAGDGDTSSTAAAAVADGATAGAPGEAVEEEGSASAIASAGSAVDGEVARVRVNGDGSAGVGGEGGAENSGSREVEEAGGVESRVENKEDEVEEDSGWVEVKKKEKKVKPRNQDEPKPNSKCPCGSKKKYKNCCGYGVRPGGNIYNDWNDAETIESASHGLGSLTI